MGWFDYFVYAGGLSMAGAAAWWLRGRSHLIERRVLNELYMRKVKLAEDEASNAIRTLNDGLVEVNAIRGRFEGLEAEVARLSSELAASRTESAALGEALAGARAEGTELRAARGRDLELLASAEALRQELARETEAGERQLVEIAELGQRTSELDRRNAELLERIEWLEGEERRATAELEARAERIHGLARELAERAARVRELEPFEEALGEARAALSATQERLAAAEERSDAFERTAAELGERSLLLQQRVEELENAGRRATEELASTEERLAAERERREAAQRRGTELELRIADLAQEVERLADEGRRSAAELETRARRIQGLAGELESHRARVCELEPLEGALAATEQRLGDEEGRSTAFEARVAEVEGRNVGLAGEVARLLDEGRRVGEERAGLAQRLAVREKELAAAREKLDASKAAEAERARELSARREELARLGAGHRALQLKLDREAKRREELEARLAAEKERASSFAEDARERSTELRALELRLERAEKGAARPKGRKETGSNGRAPQSKRKAARRG